MTDVIDSRVIKKTQDALGKIIKKPPLNDKLLKKPPFRFLHDVITNIIKTTKFFDGLYTPDEMVSENVKEKEKKIAFLQKAIDVTIMVTGENLTVKPTKIVSGHEAEKTNELLQAIAKAIVHKKDSSEAVQKVLNGEKPVLSSGNKKKGASDQSERSKRREPVNRDSKSRSKINESKTKSSVRNGIGDQRSRDRNKTKEREASKERSKNKTQEPKIEEMAVSSPTKSKLSSEESINDEQLPQTDENSQILVNGDMKMESPSKSSIDKSDVNKKTEEVNLNIQNSENASEVITPPNSVTRPSTTVRMTSARKMVPQPEPSSSSSERLPQQNDTNEQPVASSSSSSSSRPISAAPRSARPSSARPAPPKIRIRHIVENEEQIRLPSAKPVTNVILDTQETSDNEDDTFITEETPELNIETQKVIIC
ncbi:TRAF3-interacting protein 1-like [Centruroides vittatus]|uniref:TRAF3-interacting protein 1-like n=1 Tax=Centruroides vittatus TaxID=120091 RepID=UPI00350ECEBF